MRKIAITRAPSGPTHKMSKATNHCRTHRFPSVGYIGIVPFHRLLVIFIFRVLHFLQGKFDQRLTLGVGLGFFFFLRLALVIFVFLLLTLATFVFVLGCGIVSFLVLLSFGGRCWKTAERMERRRPAERNQRKTGRGLPSLRALRTSRPCFDDARFFFCLESREQYS